METTTNTFNHDGTIGLYIENILLFIWGIFFLFFPLLFTPYFTNPIILPKEILLLGIVLFSLILWGVKIVAEGKIQIRRTPFDIFIFLFAIVTLISSLIAVNRIDSLISYVPLLFILIGYFILINIIKRNNGLLFLISAVVVSGVVIAILYLTTLLKIYLLPFSYTHTSAFTPLGSLLEQALYLACILPIPAYFAYPIVKNKINSKTIGFGICFVILLLGLGATVFQLATSQKPFILPFETGFQIAFAAISQDIGRVFQGFFFGSGFGNFATDFTRFKLASFNLNQNLWYLLFNQSSSLVLELLTTTGILGLLSFLLIFIPLYKKTSVNWQNPLFATMTIILVAAFILPLSFMTFCLFFLLLALFTSIESHHHPRKFYDFELRTISMKRNMGDASHNHEQTNALAETKISKFVPALLFAIIIVFVGIAGYYGGQFILSDWYFTQSLIAASQNNGTQTYQNQINAIGLFPYRDFYYRGFSQTNMALASSLATALAQKGKNQTDQTQQQNIYKFIQQSIDSARKATALAPQTTINWQNLSAIYRQLIGFGQNAEQFSIVTAQQAATLDPTNPQEYISVGGLYYQIKQYDYAIQAFQTARTLKPDFANAYYNWGHALQEKGDLKGARQQYQIVQQLVANDPTNKKKIDTEISDIEKAIGNQTPNTTSPQKPQQTNNQQALDVNKPANVLPTREPHVTIPAPGITNTTTIPSPASPTPTK